MHVSAGNEYSCCTHLEAPGTEEEVSSVIGTFRSDYPSDEKAEKEHCKETADKPLRAIKGCATAPVLMPCGIG